MGIVCESDNERGAIMSQQEKEMLVAFNGQVRDLLASRDKFTKNNNSLKVGLESEIAVYAQLDNAELVGKRDAIISDNPDFTDVELGASQIEIRTPPIDIISCNGVVSLKEIYKQRFDNVLKSAQRRGVRLLRVGANPFLPTIGTPRTDKLKYRLVPDFYNQYRNPNLDTMIGLGPNRINIGDAAVVSLFQSFQVNLEAKSIEDACDKMNRSLAIVPYLLAFSGNARYLNYQDTRIQDARMMSWEASHDTRIFCDTQFHDLRIISWEKSFDVRPEKTENWQNELRVGLPRRYFRNLGDYLERAGTFPFILYNSEAALVISIGMTWLDARTKFIGDSAIVELRLLSTQPTIDEEILLTLLYIGRLHYSQESKENPIPINMVRENRLSAMLFGLKKPMWFLNGSGVPVKLPAKIGLSLEIERATTGLNQLGLSSVFDKDLLNSVLEKSSPSDRLSKMLKLNRNISINDMEDALFATEMLI